ncbi:alpha-1,2-fucosyltransferase [Noviherbaspirillum galbum]|uniref:Alpha-1,2-fucosyltransferase n=1 Tax=Noviherbaspirillum galbum TaxID=2709383 RepID=A0A6B3SWX1_9BURK|nr:alpha-1,2-fucosyltransferase [Noviherbaspirillum galbum]NEX63516.1 alpha-1,2-fucosyltransferase [Noviherbaspirillum galbum]
MIVVQIHSGLGNQLFMYAAARALADKLGTGLYLDVDNDCRNGVNNGSYVGHSFQLDRFNIRADYPGQVEGEAKTNSTIGFYSAVKSRLKENDFVRQTARLFRRYGVDPAQLLMKASGQERRFFKEARGDWGYKPDLMSLPDDSILRGCFFSFRYFDHLRAQLLEDLMLKEPLSAASQAMESRMRSAESVSIHVRRGDIVTDPEYRSWYEGILTEDYYRNAVYYFRERLKDPEFFVFSDDIDWVKSALKLPGRLTYVDHNDAAHGYEDLVLMSRCKHNVTAGFSSFSWWGAYLNRHPEKVVVRTRRMNALDHMNHPDDFFLPDWVIVDS